MLHEQILRTNAKYLPNKEVIIDGALRITNAELYEKSNRLANALINLGIQKGSRVAMMERNCHQYIELFFAAAKIGAILIPVNWRLKGKELSYIINDAEIQALIFGEEFTDVVSSVQSQLESVQHYIVIGNAREGFKTYDSLLQQSSDEAPGIKVEEDDVLVHMYTSGTTGVPKGVLLTHKNILNTFRDQYQSMGLTRDDIAMQCGAFFHAPLFTAVMYTLVASTVVIREFSAERVLQLIQDEKVTRVFLIPTMISFILQHPNREAYDINSLKRVMFGGMPISTTLLKEAKAFFRCNEFQQFYAQTEASSIATLLPEDHILEGPPEKTARLHSAGRPEISCEFMLVDENDHEVPIGEVGEIVVRCDSVMKGYWKHPTETARVSRNGWHHTGDLARVDSEGYIFIVDRSSDMIISGGENIYPKEIEEILNAHPSVQMAAVIGVPDKAWGESVKAILVLKTGAKCTEQEIISYCKERLAGFKKPKTVEFVDSLPLSPAGKVLKKILQEPHWKGYDKRVH